MIAAYFAHETRCLTIRQSVRKLGVSMLGSPRLVAGQIMVCARCTAAAVVLALIHSSHANAADLAHPVKAVPPLPIFSGPESMSLPTSDMPGTRAPRE
jgi:hypothetical protein